MYLAKTKALISWAVTAQLICVFVFAYAKSRFSHDAAHLILHQQPEPSHDKTHRTTCEASENSDQSRYLVSLCHLH